MASFRALRQAATLLGLTAVYVAAGKLGLSMALVHASASAVWPPTGLALAAFLLLGPRVWPAIFAGAFLVNVTTAGSAATSLGIAVGNTLEGLVGALLVERFASGREAFERPRTLFAFVALAGFASTAISASLGTASLALGGFAASSDLADIWLTWWLGDAGGAIAVAPVLILWFANGPPRWRGVRALEASALLAATALFGAAMFGGFLLPAEHSVPVAFLCLPLLIWAAFRFGSRETATAALLLSAFAIWGSLRGTGPFPKIDGNRALLLLQLYMGVVVTTALALAALVAERRRALAALAAQALELARWNAELEEFAHVVSHDLKAPLRGISSLANWIAEDCRELLPEASRGHLAMLDERAGKMRRLIDGILAYSRVGRARSVVELVDPAAVLKDVVEFLAPPPAIRIRVEGVLPLVRYDRTQIVQILQNLVGNAIQHLGKPSGEVVVACREQADAFAFMVRDDGVGIEERHFERIFRMFQALDVEGESSGVGLAIVKKIVEMRGGSISVESTPGVGSTFRFTIPKPARRERAAPR